MKPVNQMTLQEIFDHCVTHLIKQGKQSCTSNGSCAYRGHDGSRCAVGIFIPDEDYHRGIEGLSASSDKIKELLRVGRNQAGFLRRLQRIHDDDDHPCENGGLSSWDENGLSKYGAKLLYALAREYELSPNALCSNQEKGEE